MSYEHASLKSPLDAVLTSLLLSHDPANRERLVSDLLAQSQKRTERDKSAERMRTKREENARIEIPDCVDPARREACLGDPERFLRTYFSHRYNRPMERDHKKMIEVIYDHARHGGKQAVAAPRGRGKSEIAKGMLVYLVLSCVVRFPLPVCSTTNHAQKIYKDFRKKFATNDLLYEDFPEVCHPVRELAGAPARANKQHVDGVLTQIVWTANDYLSFPVIDGSPYSGVKMAYYGLDAAIRGVNIDGDRPDFVLIDDPETEESARSVHQIGVREKLIDQDLAGLSQQDEALAMVVLTTIQNRYCLSYRLTERAIKQAWNGIRFGLVEQWPDRMDLWEDYIAQRHADQTAGDEHGRQAIQFYLDNRKAMDAGATMLSDRFNANVLDDGTQTVYSSLQAAWNKIADTSMAAFRTEYQNDPEPEEEITTIGLTAARVQSRVNGYRQRELPPETEAVTVGIDMGKYASHWVKIAWQNPAIGCVIDYGVLETVGVLGTTSTSKAIELALLGTLESWSEEVLDKDPPLLCLIDSGTFTPAVYEFCRRAKKPFFAAKGWDSGRFRLGQRSKTRVPFLEAYASDQKDERLWLYNINTQYWKLWLQERFLQTTYDTAGQFNEGTLSLFNPGKDRKKHLSYAHHIVAEEQRMVPVFGKELKAEWFVTNRNNHWLDATALACAAAGCAGIRIVERKRPEHVRRSQKPSTPKTEDGRPFLVTQR